MTSTRSDITIFGPDGQQLVSVPLGTGTKRRYELMKEDSITLRFVLASPVHFPLGAWCDIEGEGRFVVTAVQSPAYDATSGGWSYELAMEAPYRAWAGKVFKFRPELGGREASWSLTAPLAQHMELFLRNLTALGLTYRGTAYNVTIHSDVSEGAKPLIYANTSLLDALSAMAEAWETEWWVTDHVIHFGRCEYADKQPAAFRLGENMATISRSDSKTQYATRLYVFGGERNVPLRYRKKLVFTVTQNDGGRFHDDNRKLSTDYFQEADVYPGVSQGEGKPSSPPRVRLRLRFLTGALATRGEIEAQLNPTHSADGQNDIYTYIVGGIVPAVGDTYEILNILPVKVPVAYFTASEGEDLTVSGIVQRRIMLPLSWNGGRNCIDASDDLTEGEAVESVVTNDAIYPRFQTPDPDHKGKYLNGHPVSAVASLAKTRKDDETGKNVPVTWYAIADDSLTFSKKYILDSSRDSEGLRLTFESGSLAGMTFKLNFYDKGAAEYADTDKRQWFELVYNEDYGRVLPDETLHPKVGDRFTLLGFDASYLPDLGLVEAAENELLAWGKEYMEKSKVDPSTYTCTMMSDYAYGRSPNGALDPTYAYRAALQVGDPVTLYAAAFFKSGSRRSRIIGYDRHLDLPYDNPQYIVGETAAYSRIGELSDKLDALTLSGTIAATSGGSGSGGPYVVKTGDTTPLTDRNVLSSLRSEQSYLSRQHADTASGRITFASGLTASGSADFKAPATHADDTGSDAFVSGIAGGHGWRIGKDGHIEADSLTLRSFLEVPELRFNRTQVILGDEWQAPGGGIIETCDPQVGTDGKPVSRGSATLHLETGEVGAIAVGDVCMGYFHFEHGTGHEAANATADSDDLHGNMTHAGFATVYFEITSVSSVNGANSDFTYMLRGNETDETGKTVWTANGIHPQPQMHFVCYGNRSEKTRQKSSLRTKAYTRYLAGVDNYTFTEQSVEMQMGDLSGLTIKGKDPFGHLVDYKMDTYGAFLGNVYMSGHIEQFERIRASLTFYETTGHTDIAYGETLKFRCIVKDGYGQDITEQYVTWTINRNSGDQDADGLWNASNGASRVEHGETGEYEVGEDGSPKPVTGRFFTLRWGDDGTTITDDLGAEGASFTVTASPSAEAKAKGMKAVTAILNT